MQHWGFYGSALKPWKHGPVPKNVAGAFKKRDKNATICPSYTPNCSLWNAFSLAVSTNHTNAPDIPMRRFLNNSPGNEVVDFLESRTAGHTGGIPQHDSDTSGQEYKQSSDLKTQPPGFNPGAVEQQGASQVNSSPYLNNIFIHSGWKEKQLSSTPQSVLCCSSFHSLTAHRELAECKVSSLSPESAHVCFTAAKHTRRTSCKRLKQAWEDCCTRVIKYPRLKTSPLNPTLEWNGNKISLGSVTS